MINNEHATYFHTYFHFDTCRHPTGAPIKHSNAHPTALTHISLPHLPHLPGSISRSAQHLWQAAWHEAIRCDGHGHGRHTMPRR
jgi:hypothetical protein